MNFNWEKIVSIMKKIPDLKTISGQFFQAIKAYCKSSRHSPSPFVFCVIYGYCMTFGETTRPDKRTFLTHR